MKNRIGFLLLTSFLLSSCVANFSVEKLRDKYGTPKLFLTYCLHFKNNLVITKYSRIDQWGSGTYYEKRFEDNSQEILYYLSNFDFQKTSSTAAETDNFKKRLIYQIQDFDWTGDGIKTYLAYLSIYDSGISFITVRTQLEEIRISDYWIINNNYDLTTFNWLVDSIIETDN